jgi:hypothetical protein
MQFDGIAEPALLNEGFRNADSPGIADAHQLDSHRFHQLFTSDYIVITLALWVQQCSEQIAARQPLSMIFPTSTSPPPSRPASSTRPYPH